MDYAKNNLWKWILLYVVIGAIAYGAIYYFFFYNKGGYSYAPQNYQTQTQTQNSQTQSEVKSDTVNWQTFSVEPAPNSKMEIKYPLPWGPSDLNLPCKNTSDAVLAVRSSNRSDFSGYNNTSLAYLVQFCGPTLYYQGFIKAPLNHMTTEQDKVALDANLKNTNEYLTAQQIISTFKFTNSQTGVQSNNLPEQSIVSAINSSLGMHLQNYNGVYKSAPDGGGGVSWDSIDSITMGDLNGDGFQDAFVHGTACGASCGSFFAVVINKNGSVSDAFSVVLDGFMTSGASQYGVKNVVINNSGTIIINAEVPSSGGTTTTAILNYKLVGKSLVKI